MDDRDTAAGGELLPYSGPDTLMAGTPVVARDGDVLGTVDGDAGDRFKVAAPMAPDYWLPKSAIAGIAPGGDLVIDVAGDALDEIKLDEPEREEQPEA